MTERYKSRYTDASAVIRRECKVLAIAGALRRGAFVNMQLFHLRAGSARPHARLPPAPSRALAVRGLCDLVLLLSTPRSLLSFRIIHVKKQVNRRRLECLL
ncbi:hypothetical protein EVAR_60693_1 [Eumeta japonica]|uniref:Uncharacterized protein n=1 Tax=Eumeta variegata TaxID=151549 RepID=A0A4C1ZJ42_EUMVA|nr:hypothetical protein EVAR_60693_1 [Eumeta japonica]